MAGLWTVACALCAAACGAAPLSVRGGSPHATAAPVTPSTPSAVAQPSASPPPATPTPTASVTELLTLTWATGFSPPAWLPPSISAAPPAPRGGSAVCGADPTGLYTALIPYDATQPSAAITIQVHAFHGPATYVNSAGAFPVDVEVSPPRADLVGLTGFQQPASVTVDPDGKSGRVTATLVSGVSPAATLDGSWRCG